MTNLHGDEAARLFQDHSRRFGCKNRRLLVTVRDRTKRDPDASLKEDDRGNLLPTIPKLKQAFSKPLQALCCSCLLCNSNHDELETLLTEFGLLDENNEIKGNDDRIKGIAILILSGCLFALSDLCHFTTHGRPSELSPVHRRNLVAKVAIMPSMQCSHELTAEDGSLRPVAELCIECGVRVFDSAISAKQSIVEIAVIRKTDKILDRTHENMPFIKECSWNIPGSAVRPNIEFYTSEIELGYSELGASDLQVHLPYMSVERK